MVNKEERLKILDEYYNSDLSRKEICEKYNLNFETFKAWIKRYNKENPKVKKIPKKFESLIEKSNFKDMTNDELKIELIKKEIELERLKKIILLRPILWEERFTFHTRKRLRNNTYFIKNVSCYTAL